MITRKREKSRFQTARILAKTHKLFVIPNNSIIFALYYIYCTTIASEHFQRP